MRILIIEDDQDLSEVVAFALEAEGYTVDCCAEGDDGLRWMRERAHDLVLLDRMLPRLDGAALLRRARAEGIVTPVLMVTALGAVEDRVEGLDTGADDYIVKPFAMKELLARIRAMGRRPRAWETGAGIVHGDTAFDPVAKTLRQGDKRCTLSRREADLLEILLKNVGKTIPRATLLARVWGPDAEVEEGNLENYVHFLRRRLRSLECPLELVTMRGVGYALEDRDGDV